MPELVVTPGTYRTRGGKIAVVCGVCDGNTFDHYSVCGFRMNSLGQWMQSRWDRNGSWSDDGDCDIDLVERISDSVSFDPPKRVRPWTPEELIERIRQVGGPLLVQDDNGSKFHIRGPVWYGGRWMFHAHNHNSDEVNLTPTRVASNFTHVSDGSPCGVEEESWS